MWLITEEEQAGVWKTIKPGVEMGERVCCASAVSNHSNNKDLQVSFVSMASQLCLLTHAIAELIVVCILCMCRIGLLPGWEFPIP